MASYHKKCANPLQKHRKAVILASVLRKVPKWIIEKKLYLELISGYFCTNCIAAIKNIEEEKDGKDECSSTEKNSSSDEISEYEEFLGFTSTQNDEVDESLSHIGISPLKFHGVHMTQSPQKINRRMIKASPSLKRKLEDVLDTKLPHHPKKSKESKDEMETNGYTKILTELKDEFIRLSSKEYRKRLQIITLSPFSIKGTMNYFGASRFLVDKARKRKNLFGILPEVPKYHKGKVLSAKQIAKVTSFYEDDEISRICPGKSDCLSVQQEDGSIKKIQKRRLLGKLQELHSKYKEVAENPVGFSTFANLRPKWCILVERWPGKASRTF